MALPKPAVRTTTERPEPDYDNSRVIRRDPTASPSNGHHPAQSIKPLSSSDIIAGEDRELIMICGKDGVGKSCAIVSLACWIEATNPHAKFFIIDSENKFRTAMRSFGSDAPSNVVYYKTDDMNQVTWAANEILANHTPGDWLAVESMSRIWERAQDLGYQAIAGMMKAEYMERRAAIIREEGGKPPAVTPSPDQLWNVVKGAHDGAFLDRLTQSETLNVILSTTMSRPPKEGGFIKENVERRTARFELGIDSGIEGAPRLPYYIETLCSLELKNGAVSCRILRDNLSKSEQSRIEFGIDNKKTWAQDFFMNCRS